MAEWRGARKRIDSSLLLPLSNCRKSEFTGRQQSSRTAASRSFFRLKESEKNAVVSLWKTNKKKKKQFERRSAKNTEETEEMER